MILPNSVRPECELMCSFTYVCWHCSDCKGMLLNLTYSAVGVS